MSLLFGIGAPEIIILLVPLALLFFFFSRRKGTVHLSLSKFVIQPDNEDLIIIEGRKTGLVQWILVKLNLGNIFQIKIQNKHITYSADSAAGKTLVLIPIHKVSSTSCGYQKPISLLIWGIAFAIISLFFLFSSQFAVFLILVLLAVVLFFIYIYMKNFFITIETTGSTRIGFSFKRSYIENIPIDIEKIESGIKIINDLIIENR